MPKYIVNGKTYNIPDDKVTGFEAKYPDATVEYHNEGKTYQEPPFLQRLGIQQIPHIHLQLLFQNNFNFYVTVSLARFCNNPKLQERADRSPLLPHT